MVSHATRKRALNGAQKSSAKQREPPQEKASEKKSSQPKSSSRQGKAAAPQKAEALATLIPVGPMATGPLLSPASLLGHAGPSQTPSHGLNREAKGNDAPGGEQGADEGTGPKAVISSDVLNSLHDETSLGSNRMKLDRQAKTMGFSHNNKFLGAVHFRQARGGEVKDGWEIESIDPALAKSPEMENILQSARSSFLLKELASLLDAKLQADSRVESKENEIPKFMRDVEPVEPEVEPKDFEKEVLGIEKKPIHTLYEDPQRKPRTGFTEEIQKQVASAYAEVKGRLRKLTNHFFSGR
jgi:hypothetical protein